MKITLIKPNIGKKGDNLYVDEGRMEPLQLGILAAVGGKMIWELRKNREKVKES